MEEAEYCCPRCKGALAFLSDSYRCAACDAVYPIVLGIPDFRVFPDPYIDMVEDRQKAARIFERARTADFPTLVEYYWSITPDTPSEMARRFTAHAISAGERGRHLLDVHSAVKMKLQDRHARVLDLGTRTGGLLMAAAERVQKPVGIDIAFRWLIIARKRLEEAGLSAQFVCCCAEFLPFRERAVDLVVAENVLEHTAQPQQCVDEAHRVLERGGVFFTSTWNRFALAPEPHVRLWGVGWLPRGLAKRYVKFRKGASHDHVRLLSVFQLANLVRRSAFRRCEILLPTFSAAELANVSSTQRLMIGLYHRIKDRVLFRWLLSILGPVLHLVCVRES